MDAFDELSDFSKVLLFWFITKGKYCTYSDKIAEAMYKNDNPGCAWPEEGDYWRKRYTNLAIAACEVLSSYDLNSYPSAFQWDSIAEEMSVHDVNIVDMVKDKDHYSPYKDNEYSSWLEYNDGYDDLPSDLKAFYHRMAHIAWDVLVEVKNNAGECDSER